MSGNGCYGGNEEVIRKKLEAEDHREEVATSDARELTLQLLTSKGFSDTEILQDSPVEVASNKGGTESVSVDFLVSVEGSRLMAIKCSMSLESRERHVLAFARAAFERPVPFCAITDGITFRLISTSDGRTITELPDELPEKKALASMAAGQPDDAISKERRDREAMVLLAFETTACPRVEGSS
ncbi:MAG: hypothetical protein KAR83_03030 [Thermodesulfovibrionales bacterium]|nr:hypothetical protein [Thermodesulfovibrionales bacterium]